MIATSGAWRDSERVEEGALIRWDQNFLLLANKRSANEHSTSTWTQHGGGGITGSQSELIVKPVRGYKQKKSFSFYCTFMHCYALVYYVKPYKTQNMSDCYLLLQGTVLSKAIIYEPTEQSQIQAYMLF